MFRRMYRPLFSQDLLRAGNPLRVDTAEAVMRESDPEPRARSQSHPHAARATVEVQRQIHAAAYSRRDFVHVRIVFEHTGEARLHHHAHLQIGTIGLE
jgi:hypothetical protein